MPTIARAFTQPTMPLDAAHEHRCERVRFARPSRSGMSHLQSPRREHRANGRAVFPRPAQPGARTTVRADVRQTRTMGYLRQR